MPSLESINLKPKDSGKLATFGMGCFWASDALFGAQPGVLRTTVGYSGGTTKHPAYKNIASAEGSSTSSDDPTPSTSNNADTRGDHTEVIEILYDPDVISYKQLLRLFWDNHEYGLTTVIKRQYMSLILYHDEDQRRIAEKDIEIEAGKRNEKLITEIAPAGNFYPAEDYHQKYRLQKYGIAKQLNINSEQLRNSLLTTKLNGYVAGLGSLKQLERDLEQLNIPEEIAKEIRIKYEDNEGGNLYC